MYNSDPIVTDKEIKQEFVGVSGVNSFIANTSSSRAVMDFSHMSSRPALVSPEETVICTGIEYELGKYINDVRAEHDCVVKAIYPKYAGLHSDIQPTVTLLVEYEKDGRPVLDFIEVDTYRTSHSFFGYTMQLTEELKNAGYNGAIRAGTILSKTASLSDDNMYMYGRNSNTVFMSHPSVAEDGFVVSESFIQQHKMIAICKRVINITKDSILVNTYGNDQVLKFLPDIGEMVRPDGLLCATRERNDWFSITDLSTDNLSEVSYTFDNLTYVPPNSEVVDITVIRGNTSKSDFTSKMTEQLDRYADWLLTYYRNISGKVDGIVNEKRQQYGSADILRITPRLRRYVTDSIIKLTQQKLAYRRLPIDQYRVEVVVKTTITPGIGAKLTDIHACKGVICSILPDHMMPRDEMGNVCHVISDNSSTISRMNLGRVYQAYFSAMARDNQKRLAAVFTQKHGPAFVNKLDDADRAYFYSYIRGMYALINPAQVEFIDGLDQERLHQHMVESMSARIKLWIPTDNAYDPVDMVKNVEATDYKPHKGKITYTDDMGRVVVTKDPVLIGELYFIMLEKIAWEYSAVSSARVNNFCLPVKGNTSDKYRYPHNLTPTKTISETEGRITSSFADPALLGELIDTTLNPASHVSVVQGILESDSAFDLEFDVDRNAIPYGNPRPLEIFRHMFNAAGIGIGYVEPNNFNQQTPQG